jgi:hypothetical protein
MAKLRSAKIVARLPDGTTLTRREWDLKYSYPLPMDFPQEFAAIANLESVKNWIESNDIDELQIRLGAVVYVHRRRYQDSAYQSLVQQGAIEPLPSNAKKSSKKKMPTAELPYFSRVRDCVTALRDTSASMDNAINLFSLIDAPHVGLIVEIAKSLPNNPLAQSSIIDIPRRLYQAKHLIDTLAISTQLGTATIIAPKGKGRPGSNYDLPVIELMNLWEEITGKKTVTPRNAKGKKGRLEGFQPSTRFIQIGLSMVDNAATSSEANTAIRRVLELRKQNEGSSLIDILDQIKNSAYSIRKK